LADFIPEETVAQVRNAANIVDVISEYVMLKKAGKNFMGLCPFHTDNKPSFTVNDEKQIYHCFGCGEGGNVLTFLMKYNNLSFPEAVGFLAEKYGIQIASRKMTPGQRRALEDREKLLRINKEAADYFQSVLSHPTSGQRAREYLKKRRMKQEVMERFLLGYAVDSWTDLIQHFSRRGVPVEELQKAGLVVASKGRHYDRFRGRVIFPILDIHQRVVGFGGRSLDDSLPKYLNSPDTPVYHKSQTLYGLHEAKETCRRKGTAFVVEGYFDLLALYCHGIENVVATLGTALTRQHVRMMKGYAQQIILVFDSDEAGIKAAKRSLSIFLEEKVDVRILVLPEAKDPDSYIQVAGSEGFLGATEGAASAMPFLVTSAIQKYGLSLEGKARVVEAMKGPLGSLPDSVTRSLYIRDLSERLGIDESAILEQVRASLNKEVRTVSLKEPRGGSRLEEALVTILVKCPEVMSGLNLEEIIEGFETDRLKTIGRMIVAKFRAGRPVNGADLIAQTEDAEIRGLISSLFVDEIEADEGSCKKIVKQYQAHQRKQQVKQLSKRIKEAEKAGNLELLGELLAEKQKWAQKQLQAR